MIPWNCFWCGPLSFSWIHSCYSSKLNTTSRNADCQGCFHWIMNCWAKPRMKTVSFSKKSSWMFGTHSRTKGWEVHDQLQLLFFGLFSKAVDKQIKRYRYRSLYIYLDCARLLIHKHLYNMYAYAHTVYIHLCLSLYLYTNIAPVARRSLSQLTCWNKQCRWLTTSHLVLNCFFHCFQVSWFGHHPSLT